MYVDTSALMPYYCPERLSRAAERALRSDPRPSVSDLVEVEFFSALSQKVRAGQISEAEARGVGDQFLRHLEAGFYGRLALHRTHYETARAWLGRFALPLRALDALHLALTDAEGLHLATADQHLARSANALGIPVTLVR